MSDSQAPRFLPIEGSDLNDKQRSRIPMTMHA